MTLRIVSQAENGQLLEGPPGCEGNCTDRAHTDERGPGRVYAECTEQRVLIVPLDQQHKLVDPDFYVRREFTGPLYDLGFRATAVRFYKLVAGDGMWARFLLWFTPAG